MHRRDFLLASGTAALVAAAPSAPSSATVLYADKSIPLDKVRAEGNELWVHSKDLPGINEFDVKRQGACRADICIPLSKGLKQGDWFHLTGFARQIHQSYVADAGVWSFGEIPVVRGEFLNSRIAPDFAVPDRKGKVVHLSDFRGKKALIVTWASW